MRIFNFFKSQEKPRAMQLISSGMTSASCFGANRWTPGLTQKLFCFRKSKPRMFPWERAKEKNKSKKQNPGMTKRDMRIIKVPCLLRPSQGRPRWGLVIDKQSSALERSKWDFERCRFLPSKQTDEDRNWLEGNPDEAGMARCACFWSCFPSHLLVTFIFLPPGAGRKLLMT